MTTHSREETVAFGRSFGERLQRGDVVAVCGNLGSGKTSFITGICEALGVRAHVTSPTFTMVSEYPAGWGTVVHIDLYRVKSRQELAELGIDEYFTQRCICLIEWGETILDILPERHHVVSIEYGQGENDRVISLHATGVEETPAQGPVAAR